ncbi:hypothetical protein, unlikely [Trypanosoma brucei gambiense DAL972]|uniref:Uncharacterized protein n=1 Tax=Trypanosoma brucei gambiense (strain MHOM/CI/86/DAL972) TaxID=679716 RepID=C9ZX80_TRYB9|nr:LOW QUALITY PROTEIN: hypothetical protein, unlikely [Trypanosoma brucei gambiense DAL972]CBH14024.1 hypothetical protein, unlikely [Trypanosoma brucei gambiense DAL972]|eukprot:XP_011776295.1 LOW QUALITY PROTEIN: hypothetical protein, unlikely [Trypanosoma brucei gambiense DAL972]
MKKHWLPLCMDFVIVLPFLPLPSTHTHTHTHTQRHAVMRRRTCLWDAVQFLCFLFCSHGTLFPLLLLPSVGEDLLPRHDTSHSLWCFDLRCWGMCVGRGRKVAYKSSMHMHVRLFLFLFSKYCFD